jgi:hypothetical protein
MTATKCGNGRLDPEALHAGFRALLPRLQLHAQVAFRDVKCPHRKADCIAEALALAWGWYVRLVQRGKDPAQFPSALATFAARAVRSGRHLVGQEAGQDVLAPLAQRRHAFVVGSLPHHSTLQGNVWDEALQDNTQSAVVDQVCFRCDFPAWRRTRSARDRRLIDDLMRGEPAGEAARKHGLSAGRVSQLRREFREDWVRFGTPAGEAPAPTRVA